MGSRAEARTRRRLMGVAEVLAACATALLAPMAIVAAYNLAAAPRLHHYGRGVPGTRMPRVSVLIPARDEADHLREALPRLLRSDYPGLEVLVLDDESADATAAVVESLVGPDRRLRLLRGRPLPEGWLGKNWACHQLAEAASGDVWIFCDADVRVTPVAVAQSVALLQAFDAGAATAIPRQRFSGWADRAVVPLVAQLPVLALLPLRLVPRTRAPSLSMANGQWLAFRRAAYARCGGHAAVRAEVLEDVALGRRVKAAGDRLVAALAPASLEVRMYASADALREGFGKNLYPLLGGRPAGFAAAVLLALLTLVYPWAGALAGLGGAALPLMLLLLLRAAGAAAFRHGAASVALHPVGSVLALGLAAASAYAARRGSRRWKGRPVVDGPERARGRTAHARR